MKKPFVLLLLFALLGLGLTARNLTALDLAGVWKVVMPDGAADGPITLPSSLDMAGYGFEVDTLSLSKDEMFRRLTRRYNYVGPAVYSRDVVITPEMAGKPLELSLERVLWKSTATIGGVPMENTETSLVAPHRHLLRRGLPAGTYRLEVTVDNTRQYDISTSDLAHSYTNDTQTIWNGILGDITLRALDPIDLRRLEVYPSRDLDSLTIVAVVENIDSVPLRKSLTFSAAGKSKKLTATFHHGLNKIATSISVKGLPRWNEFHPELHTASVTLDGRTVTATYGLRHIDNADGLRINGVPIFLRGTLECCVFPLTGVPPTSPEGWLKTFITARRWGLNHLRFHSWCPPEAAFQVADSLGFYLQVELPVWSLKIGDDSAAEAYLRDEFERIVAEYGNHPSFCLLSAGNELQHDFDWLNETVEMMKARDPRHLYTTTSFTFEKGHGGHPEPADQFFVTQWTDNGWIRGQGVFESCPPAFNLNYAGSLRDVSVPVISHEIGQYAVYPSMSEISKYTGTLNPLNLKTIRDDLAGRHLLDKSEDMTLASARLAALLYKEEIERAMKTPGMSGFQLLGLQDFPGQGTALVGLVDAFWDNKGAVDEEWFREFCSPIVPLLDFDSAVYASTDSFAATVAVANYSDHPLPTGEIEWSLTRVGVDAPFAAGTIAIEAIDPGKLTRLGQFSVPLAPVDSASAVIVSLSLPGGYTNSWKIHVYPPLKPDLSGFVATRSVREALSALVDSKNVLLAPPADSINGLESKFLPVFWSPVHFPKQAGTMGIMCDSRHPAFARFPNDGHTDWQWWQLARNAKVVVADSLPGAKSIIDVIDNFVNNRRLTYLFEARCGQGKLLFSAIDLFSPEAQGPEWSAFIASLADYINSPAFSPSGRVDPDDLLRLLSPSSPSQPTSPTSIYD
ncbi:MAG: hypothetical protein K2I64_01165 [Muribaculaceae bacterium]|nr:hypothetical protein [Muribaculaceae bacterium]